MDVAGELGELSSTQGKKVVYVIPDKQPIGPPVKGHVRKAVCDALEKLRVQIVAKRTSRRKRVRQWQDNAGAYVQRIFMP